MDEGPWPLTICHLPFEEGMWHPFYKRIYTGPMPKMRQEMLDFTYMDHTSSMPTIRLMEDSRAPVLWGITYKFMDDFMGVIGRPIPFMPWEEADL